MSVSQLNIKIDSITHETNSYKTYGFVAYRVDGYSMPKGVYTSYNATYYKESQDTYIDFSIQSPTGDSSDHHNFRFPCRSWDQAKWIVDNHYKACKSMLDEMETL